MSELNEGGLILAVPSKGRLQENTHDFFARAGFDVTQQRGARDYLGRMQGIENVSVRYLSAGEIARELARGGVHLGVTGEDLVRETIPDSDSVVLKLQPLGFGQASVSVAVPEAWIDVTTMADLEDVANRIRHRHGRILRVATKYVTLTRGYFAKAGLGEMRDYRIVESAGATEGAPAAGTADLIVDITTTGGRCDPGKRSESVFGLACTMGRAGTGLIGGASHPYRGRTPRAASARSALHRAR